MNKNLSTKAVLWSFLLCLTYLLCNLVVLPLHFLKDIEPGLKLMIMYALPFLTFFGIYSLIAKKYKYVPLGLKGNLAYWWFYPMAFLAMLGAMIFSDFFSSLIPKDIAYFAESLKEMEALLKTGFREYPVQMFITVAVFAPICEEILFRGIILENLLRRGVNPYWSIFLTSFWFGVIHMNPWQFVAALISGSVMGFLYYKTRSIWDTILLHAFNNGLVAIAYIIFADDNAFKNLEKATGMGAESVIIGGALMLSTLYYIHKNMKTKIV